MDESMRENRSTERSLIIGAGSKAPLTKAQRAFNRLIKKIDDLRRSIETETGRLNRQLNIYSSEIHPLEVKVVARRKSLVRLLHPFLNHRGISRRGQRQFLLEVLAAHLGRIVEVEGDLRDDDLKAMRDEILSSAPGTASEDESVDIEELKERAAEQFREAGIDVDLSRIRPGMSSEEFFTMLSEAEDEATSGRRAKSGRGRRVEERARMEEELRQRDLGSLYKQLAKLLHPDLERDPRLRQEKEIAMKELTTAYKEKDLHAILRLEIEWINREQADVARLTEEKLQVYNGILKKQVADLEIRLMDVAMHPRFSPLARFILPILGGGGRFDSRGVRMQLLSELGVLSRRVDALGSPEALEEVKVMIREMRRQPQWTIGS